MRQKKNLLAELWKLKPASRLKVRKLTRKQVDACEKVFAGIARGGGVAIVYGQGSTRHAGRRSKVRTIATSADDSTSDTVLVVFAAAVRTQAGNDG